MYEVVCEEIDTYLTPEMLGDVNNMSNRQTKKALNEMITYYAPENDVFYGILSLSGQIFMAITVHSINMKYI